VQLLVDKGADIAVAGNNGQTPLNAAASGGQVAEPLSDFLHIR